MINTYKKLQNFIQIIFFKGFKNNFQQQKKRILNIKI